MAIFKVHGKKTKWSRRLTSQKTFLAIGAAVMSLTGGLGAYWGNLTVYVNSYLFSIVGSGSKSYSSWVLSIYIMFWTFAMLLSAPLRRLIGKQWTILTGVLVANLALILAYVSLHYSMVWLIVTLGAMFGVGSGIVNSWLLQSLVDVADGDIGLLSAILFSAYNGGSMILNGLATLYINPSNLSPVLNLEGSQYFTQKQVVDKIPSFFLIFGLFTAVTMIVGLCIIRSGEYIKMCSESRTEEENHEIDSAPNHSSGNTAEDYRRGADLEQLSENAHITQGTSSPTAAYQSSEPFSPSQDALGSREFTPKEIFQTPVFYAVWVSFFFAEFPYLLVMTFYKEFGQIYIHDDHFLTNIGIVRAFFNIWGRLAWGVVMDKVGLKNYLLTIISLLIVTLTWYFYTAMLDKWLYLVATILVGNLGTAYFTSYIGVAALVFGKKNVSTNLGIIRSSTIVLNLVAPSMFTVMLENMGWFYTSALISLMNLLSLMLFSKFLPNV